jgi:probable phosphoglycerate mutase
MATQIVLVRHGETEWSRTGRHTGRTDIPLTTRGRREATDVGPTLQGWNFAHQFSSPLSRARETAELSGVDGVSTGLIIDDDLIEWDYGVYEGRTNDDIQIEEPGWSKWDGPLEGGESARDVATRADRVIERLADVSAEGPALVFAHGHLLAILIARWLELEPREGRRFTLETATVSVLSVKRTDRILRILNYGYDPAAPIELAQRGIYEPGPVPDLNAASMQKNLQK